MNEDWKALLINLVASAIFLLLMTIISYLIQPLLPADFWSRSLLLEYRASYAGTAAGGAVVVSGVLLFSTATRRRLRRTCVVQDRERVMAANVALVCKNLKDKNDTFSSTRVTYWDISENSPNRTKFRSAISEKLSESYLVRRLWQLQDENDVKRLKMYLEQYSRYDNYALKAIICQEVLIPEIIIVGHRAACLSLPGPNLPRKLGTCIQFFGSEEIKSLEKYYDVLWDLATPIKIGSRIYTANLEELSRHQFRSPSTPNTQTQLAAARSPG